MDCYHFDANAVEEPPPQRLPKKTMCKERVAVKKDLANVKTKKRNTKLPQENPFSHDRAVK